MHLCPSSLGVCVVLQGFQASTEQAPSDECHSVGRAMCPGRRGCAQNLYSAPSTDADPPSCQHHAPCGPCFLCTEGRIKPMRLPRVDESACSGAAEAKADRQPRAGAPFRGAWGGHICMARHLCPYSCPRFCRGNVPRPSWLPCWGISSSDDKIGHRDGHTPAFPRSICTPAGRLLLKPPPPRALRAGRRGCSCAGERSRNYSNRFLHEPFLQTL